MTVRVPVGGPSSGAATPVDNAGSEAGFQQALGQTARQLARPSPVREVPVRQAPARQGQPKQPLATKQLLATKQTLAKLPPQGNTSQEAAKLGSAGNEAPANVGQFSSIGERLVALRRELGITQVDLAKRMGSTQPALARLEKGDMKPNLRTLARYGEAIGQRVQVSFAPGAGQPTRDPREPLAVCTIEDVPETVAQVRRSLGLTQVQVAAAMDSSQPVIARLETGDGIPNLRTLERYCEALGVDAEIRFEAVVDAGV